MPGGASNGCVAEHFEAVNVLHEASVRTAMFGAPVGPFGSFTPEELSRLAAAPSTGTTIQERVGGVPIVRMQLLIGGVAKQRG